MAILRVLLGVFLAALIVGEKQAEAFGDCGKNDLYPVDGSCWWPSWEAYSYWDAADDCKDEGGVMVTPQSAEQNNFIYELIYDGGYRAQFWLGCNDEDKEGQLICEDPAVDPSTYNNWGGSQPDNGKYTYDQKPQNCIEMDYGGKWADQQCKRSRYYVCKFPMP